MSHLHYPGDHTEFDLHHIYGPDMWGAHYEATIASFNGETTAITLKPIPPATIRQRHAQQISTRIRLLALFTHHN